MGSGAVATDHADAREAIQQGRNVIGPFLGDVLTAESPERAAQPSATSVFAGVKQLIPAARTV